MSSPVDLLSRPIERVVVSDRWEESPADRYPRQHFVGESWQVPNDCAHINVINIVGVPMVCVWRVDDGKEWIVASFPLAGVHGIYYKAPEGS